MKTASGTAILALSALMLLSACASTHVIPLYEGEERDQDQIAIVELAPRLEIFSINDQEVEVDAPMFASGEREIHLEPGNYRILAFYRQLWEEPTGGHRTLISDAAEFPLRAEAGERYRLAFDQPGRLREAEELADNFHGWVEHLGTGERIDTEGRVALQRGVLASSRPSARGQAITPETETVAPQEDEEEVAKEESTEEQDEAGYLDLLKAYWSQATDEERRKFLRWISEP